MKKVLLISLGLLCLAGAAFAGSNAGAQAWLSWSPTSQVLDTAAAATNNLYVRFTRTGQALQYKGAEVDLTWDPAGDGAGCFDVINVVYKTSAGTTCTYLNRGSAVPVAVVEADHAHLAWANTSSLTTCTAGAAVQIQFETDACADPQGCISLNSAAILDASNTQDQCAISNAIVTVAGGGPHTCQQAVPVQATTWGAVKNIYNR